MAFVRKQGRQLLILHGYRDAQTGKVKQHVLHAVRSAEEAQAIAEPDEQGGSAERFRRLMESSYPALDIDWEKLRADLADAARQLPGEPAPDTDRVRNAAVELVRALAEEGVRREDAVAIDALAEIAAWATDASDGDRWTRMEGPFEWRRRLGGGRAPSRLWTCGVVLRLKGEIELAEETFRYMVECYPDDPDGYCCLGDVLLDAGRLEEAEEVLQIARETARRALPAGLPARQFWAEHHAESWREATRLLAECFAMRGRHDEALATCDDLSAVAPGLAAAISLCRGEFESAARLGVSAADGDARSSLVAAFAAFELGEEEDALTWFLHSVATEPRLWPVVTDSAVIELLEAEGVNLNDARRFRKLVAQYLDRDPDALYWFEPWFHAEEVGAYFEELDEADEAFLTVEDARRFARRLMDEDRETQVRPTAKFCASSGVEFDADGWPIDAPLRCEADEHPVSASWDLTEPAVALLAWLDKPLQHQFSCFAETQLGGSSRLYLETLPFTLPAVIIKSRIGLARELAALLGPWPRFRLDGTRLVLELVDGAELSVELAGGVERLRASLEEDDRVLVGTQRGGTKRKRRRISASDGMFLTRALRRRELDFSHYELDVRLADVAPAVWRSFLIEADATFLDLHDAIQNACGWTDSHLFAFHGPGREEMAIAPFEPTPRDPPVAGDVLLHDYFERHERCRYVYDLGDCWRHEVRVVGRHRIDDAPHRKMLGGARAFPPEDAGSLPGYDECCKVAYGIVPGDESEREEFDARRRWLGDWDPDRFDLLEAAERMQQPPTSWHHAPA